MRRAVISPLFFHTLEKIQMDEDTTLEKFLRPKEEKLEGIDGIRPIHDDI